MMTVAGRTRRHLLLAAALGATLAWPPSAADAQTADSAAGTGPSRALSTPPNAAPINQPGAMRRAYANRKAPRRPHAGQTPQAQAAPH